MAKSRVNSKNKKRTSRVSIRSKNLNRKSNKLKIAIFAAIFIVFGVAVIYLSFAADNESIVDGYRCRATANTGRTNPDIVVRNATELKAQVENPANANRTFFLDFPTTGWDYMTNGEYEYRVGNLNAKEGQKFYGKTTSPASDGTCKRLVKINGSIQINSSQWRVHDSGKWKTATAPIAVGSLIEPTKQSNPNWCEISGYPRCGYPHDLYIDDVPQRHIGSLRDVTDGTFYHDYNTGIVYIGTDPTRKKIEIAEKAAFITSSVDDVWLSGMVVEKFATQLQLGAIGYRGNGSGWQVVNNEVRLNHAAGITLGNNSEARRNWVRKNGQTGIKVVGRGSSKADEETNTNIGGNIIEENNYNRVNPGDEAGGIKIGNYANGVKAFNNCVANNYGSGIWNDVYIQNITYENNIVFDNSPGQGIFYEASYGGLIKGNKLAGNNRGDRNGGLYGSQILISTSRDVQATENTVIVGRDRDKDGTLEDTRGNGIGIIWQERPDKPDLRNSAWSNRAYNNTIVYLSNTDPTGNDGGSSGLNASYPKDNSWTGSLKIYNKYLANSTGSQSEDGVAFGGSTFQNNRYFINSGTEGKRFSGRINDGRTLTSSNYKLNQVQNRLGQYEVGSTVTSVANISRSSSNEILSCSRQERVRSNSISQ